MSKTHDSESERVCPEPLYLSIESRTRAESELVHTCGQAIASAEQLIQSPHAVTDYVNQLPEYQLINVFNPAGSNFKILFVRDSTLTALATEFEDGYDFEDEDSWFKDYEWRSVHCVRCHGHVGWKYRLKQAVNANSNEVPTVTGAGLKIPLPYFWGFSNDQIQLVPCQTARALTASSSNSSPTFTDGAAHVGMEVNTSSLMNCFSETFNSVSLGRLSPPKFAMTSALMSSASSIAIYRGVLYCGEFNADDKAVVMQYQTTNAYPSHRLVKADLVLQYLQKHSGAINKEKYPIDLTSLRQQLECIKVLSARAEYPSITSESSSGSASTVHNSQDGSLLNALGALHALKSLDRTISFQFTPISPTCLQGVIDVNGHRYSVNQNHLLNQSSAYCENKLALILLRNASIVNDHANMYYNMLSEQLRFVKGRVTDLYEDQEVEFKGSAQGEGFSLDYAVTKKILKDIAYGGAYVSAFLNSKVGGSLFLGIHDSRVVQGIVMDSEQRDEIVREVLNTLCQFIRPSARHLFQTVLHEIDVEPVAVSAAHSSSSASSQPAVNSKLLPTPIPPTVSYSGNDSAAILAIKELNKQIQVLSRQNQNLAANIQALTNPQGSIHSAHVLEIRVVSSPITHWFKDVAYQRVDNQVRPMDIEDLKRRIILESRCS